jgi:hypothetical protein
MGWKDAKASAGADTASAGRAEHDATYGPLNGFTNSIPVARASRTGRLACA